MKAKKVPLRMCVGCGEMFDKRTLVRVVKSREGEVSLDLTLKKARKKRAFERAFQMQISEEVFNNMEEEMMNAEK